MSASTTPGVLRPLSALSVADSTVSDLVDLLVPWFEHLEQGEAIDNAEIPTDEEIAAWTRGLFTDRGGRLRKRKSPAKGASNEILAVHALVRWHQSGGHLDGLFYAKWTAGQAWPRVETYVSVLRVASDRAGTSPAIEAWRRTGLIP